MRAIANVQKPSGATLELVDVPVPTPGPHDLLVKVRAAALNRADLRRTQQHFTAGAGPDIAGLEMAGEVVACGPEVTGFAPGDRVMGMTGACYAEYTRIDRRLAMRVPEGLSWASAAALPVWFMTAHDALVTAGAFRPGQHVLIQGATSGIGLALVKLGRFLGAGRTIGTSRDPAKLERLTALGLDEPIVLGRDDVAARVRDVTGGQGADVILDMIGKGQLAANVAAAALAGRIVSIGRLGGFVDEIDLDQLAAKRLSLIGVTFRTRSIEEKRALIAAMERDLAPALADGRLEPIVDRTFPLEEALAAQEYMRADAHLGKVVLTL